MSGTHQGPANPAHAKKPAPAPVRSIAEIEADITTSRENLVQNVAQLQVAVQQTFDPKRILTVQVTKVRSFYIDEYGGVRPERVAVTVGVVVSLVALRRVKRRIFNKN